jgi:hypothetical protein
MEQNFVEGSIPQLPRIRMMYINAAPDNERGRGTRNTLQCFGARNNFGLSTDCVHIYINMVKIIDGEIYQGS